MLKNRKLSVNDKKRLILLATREIEQQSTNIEETKGVFFIKQKEENANIQKPNGFVITNNFKQANNKVTEKIIATKKELSCDYRDVGVKYVPPFILHDFLLQYNNDPILKYTCHLIDDEDTIELIKKECNTGEYNLEKHSALIARRFEDLVESFFNKEGKKELLPYIKMIPLIRGYLTGKNYSGKEVRWSTSKTKTNWQLRELIDWGTKNPGIIPCPGKKIAIKQKKNAFPLNEKLISNLSGEPIRDMNDLVLYFKSLFNIRKNNPLNKILTYFNSSSKDIKEKIDKDLLSISFSSSMFQDNLELLTDVDKLLQAYKQIIEICMENQNKDLGRTTEIELQYYEENGHTFFCIHHKNSIYAKTAKNACERIGEQQTRLIKNQINGLCDLYLEADFGNDEYYKINLWDEKPNRNKIKIGKIVGVKYIMSF